MTGPVLVLNSGSSSLKAGLFVAEAGANFANERAMLLAHADGIGQGKASLSIRDAAGEELATEKRPLTSQEDALEAIAAALAQHGGRPAAVGHRVVHGGPRLFAPALLTPAVLKTLDESVHFAPLHLPGSLRLIAQAGRLFPALPQVACFDTAFHRSLPPVARQLPVARAYAEAGLVRYGFHGLSYESLVGQLRAESRETGARLPDRIVLAHLGSGSSLCAVARGFSVDTTMGMTPSGGVPMATRTGDLDPGALLFMARQGRLSLDELEAEVNHHGGLAGLSGQGGDLRQIEKAMGEGDRAAALAFEAFATGIAKAVVGLTVSLRGLDQLVFAGGAGEHSAALRAAVVDRLAPFGVKVDPASNAAHAGRIDAVAASRVQMRILSAQEDPVIAAHTRRLLAGA